VLGVITVQSWGLRLFSAALLPPASHRMCGGR
jgi:hypothetical protein